MRIRWLIAAASLGMWWLASGAPRKRPAKVPPAVAKTRAQAAAEIAETLERSDVSIGGSAALEPFFESLRQLESTRSGTVRILHYGDSHTAADEWTGTLRALLQAQFGDAGAGFSHAGRPWNTYRRMDVRSRASTRWHSEGLIGRSGDGRYGLSGVAITAQRPGEWISLDAECSQAELWYLSQPSGGRIRLGDGAEITTEGEPGAGYAQVACDSPVLRVETLDYAPLRLLGWVTEKGAGVTYETLGINSAQASIALSWDASLLGEHLARRKPALIVLAYGTNEAGDRDWNYGNYKEMFLSLIQRFRTLAPGAAILVAGPPDRQYRVRGAWRVMERVDAIVSAQRDAAAEAGCAFWDQRAKMGGNGSLRKWLLAGLAQRDRVHLTAPGYRAMAHRLFLDLMESYRNH